ncbi:globin domain-containing protein [Massilibacterium senegalense]|uniref:globin domain-containing protein n=1 Tax=Massilibacterium senegalense TaxID=1632858 RepID=UPI0007865CBC|nr:globin [Massilibacterium senegalense]
MEQKTPYEMIGKEKLWELVNAFYKRVHMHPDLKPIFPDDLTETARKQNQFLTQFLGGPPIYSEEHGHPMLRARHLPFEITPKRATAWLSCMREAMEEVKLEEPMKTFFYGHLEKVAHHMINTYQETDIQKGE